MPRLLEAKKDVTSCDKPGVAANKFRYLDFRMGQPVWLKARHPLKGGEPAELKHLSRQRKRKQ